MKGKMLIAVAGVSAMLTLTSCKENMIMTPPDLSGNVEMKGTVSCGTLKAEAEIKRTDGMWTVIYTAPDSLCGMEIVTDGTECKVTHSGIAFDYKNEDVPFITAVDYITASIDSTKDAANISLSQNGNGTTLSGSVLSSGFQIVLDKEQNIVSLSAGDYKFTAVKNDKEES